MASPSKAQRVRIVGVYHADSSFMGELRYGLGMLRGVHCSLCEISHGGMRMKEAFRRWMEARPEGIEMLHLDEQPEALAAFTAGKTPCVVVDRGEGWELLLRDDDLKACAGDVARFGEQVDQRLGAD